MINDNLNYKIIPILNSVKSPISGGKTSAGIYNSGYTSFTLEVGGIAVGKVQGCINILNPDDSTKTDDECTWTDLALIDMSDYTVVTTFSGNKKYSIGVNGMARIRVIVTNSTNATLVGVLEA